MARNDKIDVGSGGPKTLKQHGLLGYCERKARVIHVRADLPPVETERTFAHEVAHACLKANLPDDFEEVAILSMEAGLLDVMRQFAGIDPFPTESE